MLAELILWFLRWWFGIPKPMQKRHSNWPRVRALHLVRHPDCAACGTKKWLAVHHVVPVSWNPAMELEMDNLQTLCERGGTGCHFLIGHLGDFRSMNKTAREDARTLKLKIQRRPYLPRVQGRYYRPE